MPRVFFGFFWGFLFFLSANAWSQVYTSENPSTDGSYTITWDSVNNADNYRLYESVDGGPQATIFSGLGPRSRSLTGKQPGVYEYEVVAEFCPFGPHTCMLLTNQGTVTVTVSGPPAPSTPGSISGPSTANAGNYTLSWPASSGTVTAYQLQERANGGSWSTIYTGTSRSRSYNKTQNNYYDYRVRACNNDACSNYSSNKRVTIPAASITLNAPSSIARTDNTFTLSWSSVMTSSCSLSEGGVSGTSGSQNLRLPNGWTYSQMPNGYYWTKTLTMTCSVNNGGSVQQSAFLLADTQQPLPSVNVSWSNGGSAYVGQARTLSWSTSNANSCSLDGGGVGVNSSRSYTYNSAGSYSKTVTCSNERGSKSASATLSVNYQPPGVPGNISGPSTANTGSYSVSWGAASGAVTEYQLQERTNGGSWSTVYTGTSRSRSYNKTQDNYYDYRVRACNNGSCSSYTSSKRVTVPAASISLNTPFSIARTDHDFTISWSSVMASACSLSEGDVSGTSGSRGLSLPYGWELTQMPHEYVWAKTLTMTCSVHNGGSIQKSVTLFADAHQPKPTVNVSWSDSTRYVDTDVTFSWNTAEADSCTLGSEGVPLEGSRPLTFSSPGTQTISVSCTNEAGTTTRSSSISITLPPKPTVTSNWDQNQTYINETARFSWTSSGADECRLDGAIVELNGSRVRTLTQEENHALTVTCSNRGGSTDSTSNINVVLPSAPEVSASWSSTLIEVGGSSTLTWLASSNADSCEIGGTAVTTSGSQTFTFGFSGYTSRTVTCSNEGGSASAAPTLLVGSPTFEGGGWDPANDALTGGDYYGVTKGEASVNNSGAFVYGIPIDVPPGINGVQPNLALSYDSGALNGILGWGWNVSGLSAISRCPATFARDGYVSGISTGDNYRYCLDGERLVLVDSGTNEYRTEKETFRKITKSGDSWTVHNADGSKIFYGHEVGANSKTLDNDNNAISWLVDRQEDLAGNYMTYSYETDEVGAGVRVKTIEYTQNSALAGINHMVEFGYADRPDVITKYVAGTYFHQDQRLSRIDVTSNQLPVFSYIVEYETLDGEIFADPAEISRIASVKKCFSSDYVCADSVAFEWSSTARSNYLSYNEDGGNPTEHLDDGEYIVEEDIAETKYVRDFDQDGIEGEWTFQATLTEHPSSSSGLLSLVDEGVRGDFDGDGKNEIIWTDCGVSYDINDFDLACDLKVAMSSTDSGIVFAQDQKIYEILRVNQYYQIGNTESSSSSGTKKVLRGRVLDFNSDGLEDFFIESVAALDVFISNGTTLEYSNTYSKSADETGAVYQDLCCADGNQGVALTWRYATYYKDVNGDELPDYIRVPVWSSRENSLNMEDAGITDISVALNTGSGFGDFEEWAVSTDFPHLDDANGGALSNFVDVTGDGLADLVGLTGDVGVNTGSTFEYQEGWSSGAEMPPLPPLDEYLHVSALSMGGIEAVARTIADYSLLISQGNDTAAQQMINNLYFAPAGNLSYDFENFESFPVIGGFSYKKQFFHLNPLTATTRLADVNGDGLVDLVGVREVDENDDSVNGVYVSLSTGEGFTPAQLWSTEIKLETLKPYCGMMFCNTQRREWLVEDINKDGLADIVNVSAFFGSAHAYQNGSRISALYSKGYYADGEGGFSDRIIVAQSGSPWHDIEIPDNATGQEQLDAIQNFDGFRVGKPRITADGDFVIHLQNSFKDAEQRVMLGQPIFSTMDEATSPGALHHKIENIHESDARSFNITFKRLSDSSVYTQEYTGAEGDLTIGTQLPTTYHSSVGAGKVENLPNTSFPAVFRGREVVSSFTQSIQGKESEEQRYRYYNHQRSRDGFGGLGFEKIQKTTILSGFDEKLRTVKEFYQEIGSNNEYALVAPKKITKCTVINENLEGCGSTAGGAILSESVQNWKVRVYDSGVPHYFPYMLEQETRNFDKHTGEQVNTINTSLVDDGERTSCPDFTELTLSERMTSIDEHYDAYGTPLDSVKRHCDAYGVTGTYVENTNITQDTENWCLNQVQDPKNHSWIYDAGEQETHAVTRHSKFTFYTSGNGVCQVEKEVREPDAGNDIWRQTDYAYNGYGTRVEVRETVKSFPDDGVRFLSRLTSVEESFDASGKRTLLITNAEGHEHTEIYNAEFGLIDEIIDANDLVSSFQYDVLGRRSRAEHLGVSTIYHYRGCDDCFDYNSDAAYYMQEKVEGQSATRVYFDALDREVGKRWRGLTGDFYYSGQKYTAQGLPEYVAEPFSAFASIQHETHTHYDVLGRVTQTDFPTGVSQTIVYTSQEDVATVITTDTAEHSTVRKFDALAREKIVRDALNIEVRYRHDAQGNITDIKVVDSFESEPINHKVKFDLLGRKTQLVDPDVGVIDYTYNGFGHLVTQTNDENERICYTYDALDRQIQRSDSFLGDCASGNVHVWQYDREGELGLLARVSGFDTKNRAQSEEYTYTIDRLLPEITTQVINGESFTVISDYDEFNRPVGFTYPTGFALGQRYNEYGHVYQSFNAETEEVLWEATDDDPRGNITGLAYGNDATITSTYKPETGLLNTRVAMLGSAILQDHTYTFDNEGNLRSRQDNRVNITQSFCYDPLYRLTDQVINGSCADDVDGSYNGTAYAYNIHGNIIRKDGITDYQYGQSAQNAGPHAVSYANGGHYVYDNVGRMVSSPGERVIDYSAFGKPTYMGFDNGYQTEVVYGALQNRVERGDVENGQLTKTTYVSKYYERIDGPNGREHRHYMGDWGVHVNNEADNEVYNVYFTRDHIGSLASKSDDRTSATVKYHANEPWGRRQSQHWDGLVYDTLEGAGLEEMTFGTTRGFTDHEHLDGVGLIHMNGRVYDPVVGRFVSPDPWIQDPKNSQSFNRYSYVWNNPLRYTDPTGECATTDFLNFECIPGMGSVNAFEAVRDLNAGVEAERQEPAKESAVDQVLRQGIAEYGTRIGSDGKPQVMTEDGQFIDQSLADSVELGAHNIAPAAAAGVAAGVAMVPALAPVVTVGCASGDCPAWVLSGGAGSVTKKGATAFKDLSKADKKLANDFMTQFDTGPSGAKQLLDNITKNGVPKIDGTTRNALEAYRETIKAVGGNKTKTANSEVFQTRLKVLDKVLGE